MSGLGLRGAGAAAGRAGRLQTGRARSSSSTCAALVSYTDFLAICTARNERQARAIVDEVRLRVKQEQGLLPGGIEGEGAAGWIVLDYLDCVLHVFTAEARERYQLEDLWREAPRLELDLDAAEASPAASA